MEDTVYFEKKLFLTPAEMNRLKSETVDDLLLAKAKNALESKCSEHGYVVSGSVALLSRSVGYFESARFTGDAVYYAKLSGKVIYPVEGVQVVGEVIRKNKMGLYVNYKDAIRIQVPRDLHLGIEEFDELEVGSWVRIELKRSKFAIHDPFILASGLFIDEADPEEQGDIYEEDEDEDEDEDEENNDE